MAKLAKHLTLMHEIAGSNPGRCNDFFACTFFYGKNLVHKELNYRGYLTRLAIKEL